MEDTMFKNVRVNKELSLAEMAAEQINELIKERNIKKGEKLPNEFELAESLNVGRGTIREAVKLLVARNCLEIRRGKGTFVAEETGKVSDPLGFEYITGTRDKIRLTEELFEIRSELEPWIAGLAAERITEEEKAELMARCEAVEAAINAGIDHKEPDIAFHQYIAQCTHNSVLPEIIPIITYSVTLFTRFKQPWLLENTKRTHRAVAEAICANDKAAAYKAMQTHINDNLDSIGLLKAEAWERSRDKASVQNS